MNSFLVTRSIKQKNIFYSLLSVAESNRRMCSLCCATVKRRMYLGATYQKRDLTTVVNPITNSNFKKKRINRRKKAFTHLLEVDAAGVHERKTTLRKMNTEEFSIMSSSSLTKDNINSLISSEEVAEILEELDEEIIGDLSSPELVNTLDISKADVNQDQKRKKKVKEMSKANRERMAKIQLMDLNKLGRQKSLKQSLMSYLELCVNCGFLNRGLLSLKYYLSKKNDFKGIDVDVFNCLLEGYARNGNIDKILDVFKMMNEVCVRPDFNSFAYRLEAIAKSIKADKAQLINSTLKLMDEQGIACRDLFQYCTWKGNSRDIVLKSIKVVHPRFYDDLDPPSLEYTTPLLTHLNERKVSKLTSPVEGLMTVSQGMEYFREQLHVEMGCYFNVMSIEKCDELTDSELVYRQKLDALQTQWSKSIMRALDRDIASMNTVHKNIHVSGKQLNIYPYLVVLDKKDYRDIILHEIRKLAEGSETFSPTVSQLYKDIGNQVKLRYDIKLKKDSQTLEKLETLYNKYLEWYVDPKSSTAENSRQCWQMLLHSNRAGPSVDWESNSWPYSVLHAIGKFLYGIIMRDIKIDVNVFRVNQPQHLLPGFYPVFRNQGHLSKEEVKPHPVLCKLFRAAKLPHLAFNVAELPMVTPPLPWSSLSSGGYLVAKSNLIRLPYQAAQQWERLKDTPLNQMYPSFDGLNQLASVPWKVNKKVLSIVIDVFNSGGNSKLDIPEPPSAITEDCVTPAMVMPPNAVTNLIEKEATVCEDDEAMNSPPNFSKLIQYKMRLLLRRKRAEMYSLWCDALYRLSLANHFKDRLFWLPHNMDFRGRVYPCPPHLNHLGSDMARSLLVFAKGKELGPEGLNWLKIHLVNLTGLKKRESVKDRLKFANKILPKILDSAMNPLTGEKWWWSSDEPWQTLACSLEIYNALQYASDLLGGKLPLDDPKVAEATSSYVSHFPVHQDGSCNGLQHYAALGRDSAGAASVNLTPASLPQDVYSCVSAIVERERATDAKNGIKVAQILEGFVKRKVIKQTVMTTVYGVTRFGARLQIAKQLKDIDDFPKECVWQASSYLAMKTFASLREMFTSTREIQDWFTESARMISQFCGQNVEYVTPLGLPVVQPYYRHKATDQRKFNGGCFPESFATDISERPNVMKQKNAFPPNFIHSLDSSHMLLTSLHCEREGITFVSVHDCFWTHPATISVMNRVCREQFVALHSQPILNDLSDFLMKKYSYSEVSMIGDSELVVAGKRRVNSLLRRLPSKGDFDLNNVLKSVYFFS